MIDLKWIFGFYFGIIFSSFVALISYFSIEGLIAFTFINIVIAVCVCAIGICRGNR